MLEIIDQIKDNNEDKKWTNIECIFNNEYKKYDEVEKDLLAIHNRPFRGERYNFAKDRKPQTKTYEPHIEINYDNSTCTNAPYKTLNKNVDKPAEYLTDEYIEWYNLTMQSSTLLQKWREYCVMKLEDLYNKLTTQEQQKITDILEKKDKYLHGMFIHQVEKEPYLSAAITKFIQSNKQQNHSVQGSNNVNQRVSLLKNLEPTSKQTLYDLLLAKARPNSPQSKQIHEGIKKGQSNLSRRISEEKRKFNNNVQQFDQASTEDEKKLLSNAIFSHFMNVNWLSSVKSSTTEQLIDLQIQTTTNQMNNNMQQPQINNMQQPINTQQLNNNINHNFVP